jgi:outer membrane protein TolC
MKHIGRYLFWLLIGLGLTSCSGISPQTLTHPVNQQLKTVGPFEVSINHSQEDEERRKQLVEEILQQPVGQVQAVQLALVHSPDVQKMLASAWSEVSGTAQEGQLVNPSFSFERAKILNEVELTQTVGLSLLGLLSYPYRQGVIEASQHYRQQQLVVEVVDYIDQVREAWIEAMATQQQLKHLKTMDELSAIGFELAKRMVAAGNFNDEQQQSWLMATQETKNSLTLAEQQLVAQKEKLSRLLGLTPEQHQRFVLPEQLPDLPTSYRTADDMAKMVNSQKLDIQVAKLRLQMVLKQQGIKNIPIDDLELGFSYSRQHADGSLSKKYGQEIKIELPLFDWKQHRRNEWNANVLVAMNELESTMRRSASLVREGYADYLAKYEIAQRYQSKVLPSLAEKKQNNVLLYNAMLVDIFNVLSDTKQQHQQMIEAVEAEKSFWLADAVLNSRLMISQFDQPKKKVIDQNQREIKGSK